MQKEKPAENQGNSYLTLMQGLYCKILPEQPEKCPKLLDRLEGSYIDLNYTIGEC